MFIVKRKVRFPLLLVLMLSLVIVLAGWFANRDLSLGESLAVTTVSNTSETINKVALYILFFACVSYILMRATKYGFGENKKLAYGFLGFYVTSIVLPFLFSEDNYFKLGFIFTFTALLSIIVAPKITLSQFSVWARLSIGGILCAALLGALISPDKAIAADYSGLGSWIPFRLYGIGTGATSLGVLSIAYLIFELDEKKWTLVKMLRIALVMIVLILCQSKTAWALFVFLVITNCIFHLMKLARISVSNVNRFRKILFFLLFAFAAVFFVGVSNGFVRVGNFEGSESIENLTGRLYIWDATIKIWHDSPYFGYGLGLWLDEGFRNQYGSFAHAHNQFIHILGMSGVIGLMGILIYLSIMLNIAFRMAHETEVPINLLLLILVSSLTETPLLNYAVTDPFLIVHMVALISVSNLQQTTAKYNNQEQYSWYRLVNT